MGCQININDLNVLSTCPDDSELVLFFNVGGQTTGTALRTWAQVKSCLGLNPPIAGTVGNEGLPQAGESVYQDNRIKNLGATNDGNIQFLLAGTPYSNFGTNEAFDYDATTGTITLLFGTFPEGADFSIQLNQ